MFTTIVTDRGEHRPGYYKEVKRCYGTQASLLDRRSADSEDGIWVEEGVYPSHPLVDGRFFINMHFPITVLTVDDFEAVRRGGLPYGGWLQLSAAAAGNAFEEGLRRLQRAVRGATRPALTSAQEVDWDRAIAGVPGSQEREALALTRSAVKGLQDEIEDVRLESVGLATRLGPEVGDAGDQPLSARVDTLETDGQTQKFSNFLSAIAGDFTQEEVTDALRATVTQAREQAEWDQSVRNDLAQLEASLQDVNTRAGAAVERSQAATAALDDARDALAAMQETMTSELAQITVLKAQLEDMLHSRESPADARLERKVEALTILFADLDGRMGSTVSRGDLGDVEARCTAQLQGRATPRDLEALESSVLTEIAVLTSRLDGLRLDDISGATAEVQDLVREGTMDLKQDLAKLLQVEKGAFWNGGSAFNQLRTEEDLRAFLDAENVSNGHRVMSDFHTDLARTRQPTANSQAFTQELLLESKTKRTPADVQVDVSFQGVMPSQLATPEGKLKARNYNDWNPGDGVCGQANVLLKQLELVWTNLATLLNQDFRLAPKFRALMEAMLDHTKTFVRALWAFINSFYTELLTNGYAGDPGSSGRADSWSSVDTFIVTLLETLGEARQGGTYAFHLDGTDREVAYLSAFLQSHHVMAAFMDSQFKEHAVFFPKLVNSMFSSMVTRAQLKVVETAATAASREAAQAISSVESIRRQVTQLDSRVNNMGRNRQNQGPGQGDQGGGRGRGRGGGDRT